MSSEDSSPYKREAQEAISLFSRLGWSVTINRGHVSFRSDHFASLLCSGPIPERRGWLSDGVIDLMVEVLNERLGKQGRMDVFIGSVRVVDGLMSVAKSAEYEARRNPEFSRLSEAARHDRLSYLYFPVCAGNRHWVTVCVDFKKNNVQLG